jgi:hypothetical protein
LAAEAPVAVAISSPIAVRMRSSLRTTRPPR